MNLHRNISRAILSLALLYTAPSAYPFEPASAFVFRNIRDVSNLVVQHSPVFFLASQEKPEEAYEKISKNLSTSRRSTKKETILKRILKRGKNQVRSRSSRMEEGREEKERRKNI